MPETGCLAKRSHGKGEVSMHVVFRSVFSHVYLCLNFVYSYPPSEGQLYHKPAVLSFVTVSCQMKYTDSLVVRRKL